MSRYHDKLDPNDLAYAMARASSPIVACQPAPYGGNGGINPHVTRFKLLNGSLMDLFHIKPVYYETKCGSWRPLSEVTLHHGNRRIVIDAAKLDQISWRYLEWLAKRQRLLGTPLDIRYRSGLYSGVRKWEFARAATLTAFPDPNPETVTVDGRVFNDVTATWDTTHDATDGSGAGPSEDPWFLRAGETSGGVNFHRMSRGFTLFDTSALTASASVSAIIASLFGNSTAFANTDNDGTDWINVMASSPASNTDLVVGDFDQCGDAIDNPTEFCDTRIDLGSFSEVAYNDFAFNAAGLASISLTAVSKYGWREGHDATDAAITANTDNLQGIEGAENAGTTSDPKMVVTYTLPGGALLRHPGMAGMKGPFHPGMAGGLNA